MFLLNKPYETCKSCETLKEQLEFERSEKKQLTETLLNIIKPKTYEAAPIELEPVAITGGTFARRRAALEARDRAEAQILKDKKFIGEPDRMVSSGTIEQLEKELGVQEEKNG